VRRGKPKAVVDVDSAKLARSSLRDLELLDKWVKLNRLLGSSTSQACICTGMSASGTENGEGPLISIDPLLVHPPKALP
jgi:hypothetical protein